MGLIIGREPFANAVSRDSLVNETLHQPQRDDLQAHMFWAYGDLSNVEIACAQTFLNHGWNLNYWMYDGLSNAPSGVVVRDARELIPEKEVFSYRNGSYSAFSNLFRYTVLTEHGGLWSDSDVICLLPKQSLCSSTLKPFVVTEKTKPLGLRQINPNVIFNPTTRKCNIINLAQHALKGFDKNDLHWGEPGPLMLTALAKGFPRLCPTVMAPEFANPLPSWSAPDVLFSDDWSVIPNSWGFLHLFNEVWRRTGKDKSLVNALGTNLDFAFRAAGVDIRELID